MTQPWDRYNTWSPQYTPWELPGETGLPSGPDMYKTSRFRQYAESVPRQDEGLAELRRLREALEASIANQDIDTLTREEQAGTIRAPSWNERLSGFASMIPGYDYVSKLRSGEYGAQLGGGNRAAGAAEALAGLATLPFMGLETAATKGAGLAGRALRGAWRSVKPLMNEGGGIGRATPQAARATSKTTRSVPNTTGIPDDLLAELEALPTSDTSFLTQPGTSQYPQWWDQQFHLKDLIRGGFEAIDTGLSKASSALGSGVDQALASAPVQNLRSQVLQRFPHAGRTGVYGDDYMTNQEMGQALADFLKRQMPGGPANAPRPEGMGYTILRKLGLAEPGSAPFHTSWNEGLPDDVKQAMRMANKKFSPPTAKEFDPEKYPNFRFSPWQQQLIRTYYRDIKPTFPDWKELLLTMAPPLALLGALPFIPEGQVYSKNIEEVVKQRARDAQAQLARKLIMDYRD